MTIKITGYSNHEDLWEPRTKSQKRNFGVVCLFVHIPKTIQKENSFMKSTSGLQKEHQMSVILQKHNETREILNNCSLQNVINFL